MKTIGKPPCYFSHSSELIAAAEQIAFSSISVHEINYGTLPGRSLSFRRARFSEYSSTKSAHARFDLQMDINLAENLDSASTDAYGFRAIIVLPDIRNIGAGSFEATSDILWTVLDVRIIILSELVRDDYVNGADKGEVLGISSKATVHR